MSSRARAAVAAVALFWGGFVPAQLDHVFGSLGFTSEAVALLVLVLVVAAVALLRSWGRRSTVLSVVLAAATFVVAHLAYVVWACSRGCTA